MILLIYLLKTLICSAVFYAYYLLALRDKSFHQYNRFYLLLTPVLAILLPLVRIRFDAFDENDTPEVLKTLQALSLSGWEEEFVVTPHRSWIQNIGGINWLCITIYSIGTLLVLIPLVRSFVTISRLSGKYRAESFGSIRFYNTNEPGTPFSFFRSIFWNRKINPETNPGRDILRHEMFHVTQNHSFDLVFIEVLKSLFWFNPFFHFIKNELRAIHEFLADKHASAQTNKYDYAETLVLQAMELKSYNLYHHFFNTEIKRRVIMITKTKMGRYSYFARVMALPVAFIIFCAFSVNVKTSVVMSAPDFIAGDTMPMSELKKIDLSGLESFSINDQTALLTMKGKKSILVKRSVFDTYVLEQAEQEKKNKEMIKNQNPKKSAQNQQGRRTVQSTASKTAVKQEYDKTFTKVEIEAAYPGGVTGWTTYLSREFRYPKEAQDKEISGTVILQFIVDQEGTVSNVEALSGPTEGFLREEGIRVIRNSGKWLPAVQNGQKVKSYKKQPITFKLQAQ